MLPNSLTLGANRGPGSDSQSIKPVFEPGSAGQDLAVCSFIVHYIELTSF